MRQDFTRDVAALNAAVDQAATAMKEDGAPLPGSSRERGREANQELASVASNTSFDAAGGAAAGAAAADAQMRRFIQQMQTFAEGIESSQRGHATFYPLMALAKAQGALEGRKAILFFSEGLAVPSSVEEAFQAAISEAKETPGMAVLAGGVCDGREGWFVQPTLLTTEDPMVRHMKDECFGPIVTIHVYPDAAWDDTLKLVDRTSPYALTGAVFARDRAAVVEATHALRNAAGNFYINDKPTGAVVGQQPFGGARGSGTNDKAGSKLNLVRWISARTIKETLSSPLDWRYPFLAAE
jgi:hypothetical protein